MSINNLKIFREVKADFLVPPLEIFVKDYLPYTVRDESVNREGVLGHGRKGYLSHCAVGYVSKTAIHLVDLEKLYDMVTNDVAHRDPIFAFIKGFFRSRL